MSRPAPLGVGIVGAGVISDQYLATLTSAPDVAVRFVADLDTDRAKTQADEYGVVGSGTYDQLLADRSVETVANLTIPQVHAEVTKAALDSGRHVWSEKPLATTLADAHGLVELAQQRGVRLGCAPDTFLGTGPQTALRVVAEGGIGTPRTGFASLQYRGPDFWHPSPEFLFAQGAGPVLDVGPYFLTTLVLVFGSLQRVTARGVVTRKRRMIATGPKAGTEFDVHVPSHVNALYEFTGGGLVDAILSFDSPIERMLLEVTGTEGAITMPNVNDFGDHGVLYALDATSSSIPAGTTGGSGRGTGLVDLARSVRSGEQHRADGRLALHVLEALLATEESIRMGQTIDITTMAPATALLPPAWSLPGNN